jgi:hypothetical protein
VSVSVGDFRSESDDDEAAREREETKRLVYVALTRARDRLYLASVLKEGRLQPARGSLAEVLPASLLETFNEAAAGVDSVRWQSRTGKRHHLCLPRDEHAAPHKARSPHGPPGLTHDDVDFGPLADVSIPRLSVGALLDTGYAAHDAGTGDDSDRLRGTLVHRLLQRLGLGDEGRPPEGALHVDDGPLVDDGTHVDDGLHTQTSLGRQDGLHVAGDQAPASLATNDEGLRSLVVRLARHDERHEATDPALVSDVVGMFRAICRRKDVREVYLAGEAFHEVPFTLLTDGRIVRGTIDCLIRAGDLVTILEFKTGRRRGGHEEQVDLYRRAAQAIFPGARIEARVIYAREVPA